MKSVSTHQQSSDRSKQLISLLLSVAENELLTHQLYIQLRASNHIDDVPGLSGLSQLASSEDWEHYYEILQCIGRLKGDKTMTKTQLDLPHASRFCRQPIPDLLRMLQATEKSSVKTYAEICSMTLEYDYRTFDISYRNLQENMHHQDSVDHILANILYPTFSRSSKV